LFVILIYDISDHSDKKKKNITKIRKCVEQYLHRVQYSVFEGEIQPHLLKLLESELKKLIDKKYDSIVIYSFTDRKYSNRVEMGIKREHNMFS